MLAKWLGRRALPAGLLVLLLAVPASGEVSDTAAEEVPPEVLAVDDPVWDLVFWGEGMAWDAWDDLGGHSGTGPPHPPRGLLALPRLHDRPRDEGPSVSAPPSPTSRDAGDDQPERSPSLAIVEPIQATVDDVLAQLPVGVVVEIAQRAQQAAEEARRALPALAPATAQEAEDFEADAAATAPATPTHLVLGATILAVGAAAAATFAAFWMAGSSGSVGAAAATKGGAEMRRLLPFASPLFTRFGKDTVLGHPRREALYARILQEPGISLQALGEATGLSRTAVVHHLRLLEQQHLVVSRRVGRGRHYFENGGRYGHDQKEAYAVLQNDRSRAVAEAIRARPGMMQKTLCAQLSIPPSIAHWHVTRLAQANLVQVVRQGRTVAYFPGHAMPALNGPRSIPSPEPAPMVAPMQVAPA